jgi:hypothetical protein
MSTTTVLELPATEARSAAQFAAASQRLLDALPKSFRKSLRDMKYLELNKELIAEKLNDFIENFIQSREEYKKDSARSRRAKWIVLSWFTASYLFATEFITITKEALSLVRPQFRYH